MSAKVLVILGTGRDNSNTAKALKNHLPFSDYEMVELHKLKIEPYSYQKQKPADDFLEIARKMSSSDIIVFATPVYWYAMSAEMKKFFDRLTDLITTSKDIGRSLKGKDVYLFSTGSDTELPAGFEIPFVKTSEYFEMNYRKAFYFSVKE